LRSPLIDARRAPKWSRWALISVISITAAVAFTAAGTRADDLPKVENPHGKFKADCGLCHGAEGWKPAKISKQFNHASYGFALVGAHAAAQCMSCHSSLDFSQGKQLCVSCHKDPHRGEMGTDCARCHSSRSFVDRSAMVRQHQQTSFPLTGSHAQIDCEQCHKPSAQGQMQFVGTKAECQACHLADYQNAKSPDHAAGGFPLDCTSCHSTLTWTTKTFDHSKTAFPLTGAHVAVPCAGCHGDGVYKGKTTDCYGCHQTDYNGTTSPPHASAGYSTTCLQCHTTASWTTATFNHNTMTTFPLTGAHQSVACSGCHSDGVYKGKSTLCYSCHTADYNATTNPPHAAAGFATTCETCHSTTDFTSATFNHNTQTTFPLTGAHVAVACSGCHASGVYKGLSTLCYSCHTADFTGTTDPKHSSAAFATTCDNCHTTAAWTGATFDHTANTTFPLTGGHVGLDCNACHSSNVFKGLSMLCYSCHQADYTGATNPPHQTAGFPTTCETCHSTANWTSSTFNHNTSTTFPLTGAHQAVSCNGCHSSGVYKGLSTLCYSCHTTDFQTTVVNHTAAGFATTCENCHTTTAWNPGTFNHTTGTTFPLTGAHIPLLCNQCHSTVFKGLSTLCYSCHQANYTGTTQPPHASAGFPTTCDQCHTTTDWGSGTFDHNTNTTFPLTGAHIAVACNGCHASGVYKGLSTLCYSCHASSYQTTVLNHTAAGFATTCENCHNTTAWNPGTFNHTTGTTFPLTGAHTTLLCSQCHSTVFKGLSTLCYSCHQTDYQTTVVSHSAAGFGTACDQCHTTTAWSGGKYTAHDTQFPIYSGTHNGKWSACTDCHTNTTNYLVFACYGSCHPVATIDKSHSGRNGYVVGAGDSNKCYSCHPKGSGG